MKYIALMLVIVEESIVKKELFNHTMFANKLMLILFKKSFDNRYYSAFIIKAMKNNVI